jgi:hypothetical protein
VVVSPTSDYKDKYSHLIGKGAAKDAAHMLQANKTYGCGEPWWELGSPGEKSIRREEGSRDTLPTLLCAPSACGQ